MATKLEVAKILQIFDGANLRFPPRDIRATGEVWADLLADVPGLQLLQGARDLAMRVREFPTPAEVREAAYQVKLHNGVSAVGSPWKQEVNYRILPGVLTLDDGKWVPKKFFWGSSESIYPPEVWAVIDEVVAHTDEGLMSDEDFHKLEVLVEPYMQQALPRKPVTGD